MIQESKNIFIVGIGGSAMCNLAIILKKMGNNVSGSDLPTITTTDKILHEYNIPFITNFEPDNLPQDTDLVIYSGSFSGAKNQQVIEAQKRNITILSLAEMNGILTQMFDIPIAVCGTHGKTTTSSLLAYALNKLGVHPSYLIGTSRFNDFYGGKYDGSEYFVIEADEYAVNPPHDKTPKFHLLYPRFILCNNIDFDHPDVYKDLEHTKLEFKTFFTNALQRNEQNKLFVCADNDALMQVARDMPEGKVVTYGYQERANFQIVNAQSNEHNAVFELIYSGKNLGTFTLSIFGTKNISNAAGVISLLVTLGFDLAAIKESIKGFVGAKRRFEQVAFIHDIYLFDDYAHNPQKVEAAIMGAKERFKTRRVIVVFQPHTYSRTMALKDEFAQALGMADVSLIAPIFASAREKQEDYPVTSHDIEIAARQKAIYHITAYDDIGSLLRSLSKHVCKGDVIIMMGAGDINKVKNDIISLIQSID